MPENRDYYPHPHSSGVRPSHNRRSKSSDEGIEYSKIISNEKSTATVTETPTPSFTHNRYSTPSPPYTRHPLAGAAAVTSASPSSASHRARSHAHVPAEPIMASSARRNLNPNRNNTDVDAENAPFAFLANRLRTQLRLLDEPAQRQIYHEVQLQHFRTLWTRLENAVRELERSKESESGRSGRSLQVFLKEFYHIKRGVERI